MQAHRCKLLRVGRHLYTPLNLSFYLHTITMHGCFFSMWVLISIWSLIFQLVFYLQRIKKHIPRNLSVIKISYMMFRSQNSEIEIHGVLQRLYLCIVHKLSHARTHTIWCNNTCTRTGEESFGEHCASGLYGGAKIGIKLQYISTLTHALKFLSLD